MRGAWREVRSQVPKYELWPLPSRIVTARMMMIVAGAVNRDFLLRVALPKEYSQNVKR